MQNKKEHLPDQLKLTYNKLNEVSSSFCLAKWHHLSLHLHLGHNHSCHHPNTHKININQIKKDPSFLHNTSQKKRARQQMLTGHRPKECSYCWTAEDSGAVSDRIFKSDSFWAKPHLQEAINAGAKKSIFPKYLEVSFSHACNFSCSYCDPRLSSSWEKEVRKFGPYMLSRVHNGLGVFSFDQKKPWPLNVSNPYVEAFWDWWPELYNHLKVLRVTGGEPLLSQDTFKLLDKILTAPHPNLHLAINTNLGVSAPVLKRFIDQLKRVQTGHHVQKLQVFTSVDSWGEQAEYIRHGMKFKKFWTNLELLLTELPQVELHIMSTYNSLSAPNFHQFIKHYLELKNRYKIKNSSRTIDLDVNHLTNPSYQSALVLPLKYILAQLDKAISQLLILGEDEKSLILKLERIKKYVQSHKCEKLEQEQADFFKFFTQHDQRRGTDFLSTFPELQEFWHICAQAARRQGDHPKFNVYHRLAGHYIKLKYKT